jgi:glycosyltransferase involved in cell wall biosynthesis
MKIAIVTLYFQPEFGYEEYHIARNLARLGHDVSLITSDRIFPFKNVDKLLEEIGSEHTDRYRGVGVSDMDGFTVYRLPILVEFLTDISIIMNVGSTLEKIKPDLVHLHEPIQCGSAVAALHKGLGFKLVVEQHGYATTFDKAPTLKNKVAHYLFMCLRRPVANYAFSKADAITCINDQAKKFMVEIQKLPEEKIRVIPLGTDDEKVKFDKVARSRIRGELGIEPGTILIITAGRIDRAKKYELLIEAFSKLKKKIDVKLLLIGSGDLEYENELKERVKSEGLDKNIMFMKFINKSLLPEYFSAADIGFWNKEAITIIDALSCGLPVVLPDQVTIKHYILNDNGLFFTDKDVKSLQEQLYKLATDKQLRKAMGGRGVELVKKRFSYDVTTQKYLKVYEHVLGKKLNN